MTRYIIRRLISLIPTLLGVTVIVFLFIHLIPGDPAIVMLGEHAAVENVERIREQLGLNKPLFLNPAAVGQVFSGEASIGEGFRNLFESQYFLFLGRLLRGDLGRSVHGRTPIADLLKLKFPATVELSLLSMAFAIAVGIPAGIISATRRNSVFDSASMIGSLVGVSMPVFWLGLMLIYFFGVRLKWFPTYGRFPVDLSLQTVTGLYTLDSIVTGNYQALRLALKHLVMPSFALGTIPMAIIARMTRSAMLEVLQEDYIRTAYAKGLQEKVVILRHALKNAFLPVITIIGLQVGGLLAGAIMTETVFSWPGVGKWVYDAILSRDYPVVQVAVLIITLVIAVINLAVDVSYAFLNPKIRFE
ncbi:MAG: ABC transporter permease [Chloroflexi bacterium]|nr:ABC transporter permease [Chloroflexota bacterium]